MRACWREVRLSSFLKREHCRTIEGFDFITTFGLRTLYLARGWSELVKSPTDISKN